VSSFHKHSANKVKNRFQPLRRYAMPAVQVKRAGTDEVNTDPRALFPVSVPGGRAWLVDPSRLATTHALLAALPGVG
jgi:hypothetical protein